MRTPALGCWLALAWMLCVVQPCGGQFAGQKTYCNPMDINYQYNFEQKARGISYRSGADPVIVNHNGEYSLFVTISGGWWHSKDLVNWRFIKPDVSPHLCPKEDMCAPAAISVGGKLYLFQSTFERRPIRVTTNPETGVSKPRKPASDQNRALESMMMVTGPSLVRFTFMSAPNSPVCTGRPKSAPSLRTNDS